MGREARPDPAAHDRQELAAREPAELGDSAVALRDKSSGKVVSVAGGGSALDLYWLPLGAGGHFVWLNGRVTRR